MSVTIDDVAARCGLSRATVSRAFSRPDLLRVQTRERVLEAARSLGFSPNAIARAMVRKKTESIGFILSESQTPALLNPFYAPILHAILQETTRQGYSLLIASSSDMRRETGVINLNQHLDGVILAGQVQEDLVSYFQSRNIPMVALNNSDHEQLVSVTHADEEGTRLAMQYLLESGRKRIGYVGGRFSRMVVRQRGQAYSRSMEKAGLSCPEEWVTELEPTMEASRSWLENRIRESGIEALPEAFFCANDTLAVGIVKALLRSGVQIPETVAVVGFDDSQVACTIEPELTTVRVPKEEMGRKAIELLMQLMRGEEPESVVLPAVLVKRESA